MDGEDVGRHYDGALEANILTKKIEDINLEDLQRLVADQIAENRILEYKQTLQLSSESEKKEFLADISSFANSIGGYVIYGMVEDVVEGKKTGKPKEVIGLFDFSPDQEILRLESIVRDGIKPRLNVQTRAIPGAKNGPVLVIKVPQSWNSPHMVGSSSRFYARAANGKYQLDIDQLREAFLLSDNLSDRIRNFRIDRFSKIVAGDQGTRVSGSRLAVLHLVPVSAFRTGIQIPLPEMRSRVDSVGPISSYGYGSRYNIDGIFQYWTPSGTPNPMSYVQYFSNGIIEAVDGTILGRVTAEPGEPLEALIPTIDFEQRLIKSLGRFLRFQAGLGVSAPVVLMVSLKGVMGLGLGVYARQSDPGGSIDRDPLFLPDILIEDLGAAPHKILRPVLDAFYNSAGWEKCLHYQSDGSWAIPT